jgi:ATP-binding cassette, subfamily B, bacterial
MSDPSVLTWPLAELGSAIEALARKSGLSPKLAQIPHAPEATAHDSESLGRWIEATAVWMGLEAEPVAVSYRALDQFMHRASPALFRISVKGSPRFLVVLASSRSAISILRPDLGVARVRSEVICSALSRSIEKPLLAEIDRLLADTGISQSRNRIRTALMREKLRDRQVDGCWLLQLPPSSSFWRQMFQARLPQALVLLASMQTAEYAMWILAWWLVGRASLEGRFDNGWLLGWALLLVTLVPLLLLSTWLQGVVAIGGGVLLKRRLLYGALRLHPDEIRYQGAGQFLGRVIESEAVESLALSGGFLGLAAVIELVLSAAVLGAGAVGVFHVLLLLAWTVLTFSLSVSYFRRRQHWTTERLQMTHDLVERMVGHRTWLVQEPRERWHEGEDQTLERYQEASAKMDHAAALLMAFAPRGWLLIGLLALSPEWVTGRTTSVAIAVSLGGILLAYRALRRLASGLWNISDAAISWKQVAQLFGAATRTPLAGPPIFVSQPACQSNGKLKSVEAHDLVFGYVDRNEPVLRGCNFSVGSGEKLLLEGRSGGGKSTLASLLTGMRLPRSGLLLIEGLDWNTLGEEGWRRRVVSAPQFHENHVLTETFAFNLLMGRRWPPRQEDLQEAEVVCRELGLGELLDRMPAGLFQMVGETGWQLSHGERSRLYIARALLQRSNMIILDESFAALDPETLQRSLNCVLHRAPALMVIAHP